MNKSDFREALQTLLDSTVDDHGNDDRVALVSLLMAQIERQRFFKSREAVDGRRASAGLDQCANAHELPISRTCISPNPRLDRAIYRWAAETDASVKQKRPDDKFVQQIKRIAKQVVWVATG